MDAAIRTLLWLSLTLVGVVLALVPAFLVGSALGSTISRHPDVTGGDAPLRLGIAAATWVALTVLVTMGVCRLVGPTTAAPARLLLRIAAVAALTAGIAEFGVTEWAVLALGRYDAEFPDPSMLMPVASVAMTIGIVGYLVAAGAIRKAAGTLAAVMSILSLTWCVSNVRGLADGLSEGAWALGVGIAAAAFYVLVVVALIAIGAGRSSAPIG